MTGQRGFDFLGSPGGITQSFANVGFFQVWISLEDFSKRVAAGDQADKRADRHAQAADARLAAHELGIERDAGELGHSVTGLQKLGFQDCSRNAGLVSLPRINLLITRISAFEIPNRNAKETATGVGLPP